MMAGSPLAAATLLTIMGSPLHLGIRSSAWA
jgi:hypothetical protein